MNTTNTMITMKSISDVVFFVTIVVIVTGSCARALCYQFMSIHDRYARPAH
jgi:hypothetical protein